MFQSDKGNLCFTPKYKGGGEEGLWGKVWGEETVLLVPHPQYPQSVINSANNDRGY